MSKTFTIHSFGCKVNQEEGEQLAALFTERGWRQAETGQGVDLYIINTCTVTQVADKKSRALIRRLRRENPGALLAVTGCYAQTSAAQIAELSGVDIIAGLQERAQLPDLVERRLLEGSTLCAVTDISANKDFATIGPTTRQKRSRAYLKIEDGCGEFCHYCVIPYARGPVRSLPMAQALAEARQLLVAGHRELVLSGIHIGAYGEDLPEGQDLPTLIEGILGLAGISEKFRLRLGSLEPQQFSEQLLRLFEREQRLCPHVHIPLQAGCDATLAAMNRHYTTAEYAQLLGTLRSLRPGLAVTTDVMVGFPGESAADFEASLDFCRRMGFAKMHVFPYSRRSGTVAADMPGQIAQQEKARRAALMAAIEREAGEAYAQAFIGQELQYLFEQELDTPNNFRFAGHSENYLPLLLAEQPPPELVFVRALEYREGYLLCEFCKSRWFLFKPQAANFERSEFGTKARQKPHVGPKSDKNHLRL